MKLMIYLGCNGYNITTDGINPMEFVDGSQTQNILIYDENGKKDLSESLKEAISQCTRHDYEFEVI